MLWQVANALQNFMANLTKGYALSQAGGSQGATPGATPDPAFNQGNTPGDLAGMPGNVPAESTGPPAAPQGSIEVGQPGNYTDTSSSVMSQISPDFSTAAQSALPSYVGGFYG